MNDKKQLNLFYEVGNEVKDDSNTRTCRECKVIKPLTSFELDAHSWQGYKNTCKKCKNISKQIRRLYTKRMGYPDEDYECPICKDKLYGEQRTGNAWCVDHNHKTGYVRGYICPNCNNGMGYLRDDINILEKSIEWINKEKEKTNDGDRESKRISGWW